MLPVLGKELRKLRIDRDLRLFDLAKQLGVTTAFLSAIETGRKPAPANFVDTLTKALELTPDERGRLEAAVDASRTTARLELENRDERTRQLAAAFARTFNAATDTEVAQMLSRILGDKKA
jgi:transcriptional regulator with XRE-family HTH domain